MVSSSQLFPTKILLCALWLLSAAPRAEAQRYLSEFVGVSRVTANRTQLALPSNFTIDTLDVRRLGGSFSYLQEGVGGQVEEDAFKVSGVVETSGKCRAQLDAPNNRGTLSLFEANFDPEIFALVGTFSVEKDLGLVSLSRSGLIGTSAFLRPALSPVPVPLALSSISLKSSRTGATQNSIWAITESRPNESVGGAIQTPSGANLFNIVASASNEWLYAVGTGSASFFTLRAAVQLDSRGNVVSAVGPYRIVDERARTLDEGTAEISPLP